MYVKIDSSDSNVIIWFIFTPYLPNPFYLPLLSQRTLHPQTKHLTCVLCVCRFDITCIYIVWTVERKYISLCLNSDQSLITYLHIFVYEHSEFLFRLSRLYIYTFILYILPIQWNLVVKLYIINWCKTRPIQCFHYLTWLWFIQS